MINETWQVVLVFMLLVVTAYITGVDIRKLLIWFVSFRKDNENERITSTSNTRSSSSNPAEPNGGRDRRDGIDEQRAERETDQKPTH